MQETVATIFEECLRCVLGSQRQVNTPFESHYLISHPGYIQYILQNNRQNYSVQTAGYEVGQGYFGHHRPKV